MTRKLAERLILLSSASLCAAVLLCACGAARSPARTAASSFAASANQICSRYYAEAYALSPPIGLTRLLELAGKQQELRERELSELTKLTAPAPERNAFGIYVSSLASAHRDRAPYDGLAHAEVAYMRPRQPSPSPATLQAQLKPSGSERSIEAIKARERADVAHEANTLRSAPRALSVSPRVRHSLMVLVEHAVQLEKEAGDQAQTLGLTVCARDPYSAEHTYYESSGEETGFHQRR